MALVSQGGGDPSEHLGTGLKDLGVIKESLIRRVFS